jgi:hypothetical protein
MVNARLAVYGRTGEEITAMLGTTVAPDLWDWAR